MIKSGVRLCYESIIILLHTGSIDCTIDAFRTPSLHKIYGFVQAMHPIIKTLFMEKTKILQASLLDIIFDDRNKVYGAYELRNRYTRRLTTAMVITGGVALLVLLASFVGSKLKTPEVFVPLQINEVEVTELTDDLVVPPPPEVPPPAPVQQPEIAMSQFVNPKVIKDDLVTPEEMMKDIAEIERTQISTVNRVGIEATDVVKPPVEENHTGVITGPKTEPKEEVFIDVQIQAKFPGGEEAWRKYISREIERHMDELQDDGKAGSCMVQFVVDKEGVISDVEVLTMKGSKLAEITANAIRKGPKWVPAENNGKKVKAYRRQPVTFQLFEQ